MLVAGFLGNNTGQHTPAKCAALLSGIAATLCQGGVERAIAHLKIWLMLSEEGGRYRAPISKYGVLLQAAIGPLTNRRPECAGSYSLCSA